VVPESIGQTTGISGAILATIANKDPLHELLLLLLLNRLLLLNQIFHPVGLELSILALNSPLSNVTRCRRSDLEATARMRNLLLALLHVAVIAAGLCGPGGVRTVIAEHLLLKHQLIV